MTPAEIIIATTFSTIPIGVRILSDRVLLSVATLVEAHDIIYNCDALLPPLELTGAPQLVYIHCTEDQSYHEVDRALMALMGAFHARRQTQ